MTMENKDINPQDWEKIASYLTGEMNENEIRNFELELSIQDSKRELFLLVENDISQINKLPKMKKLDANKAWENLSERILKDEKPEKTAYKFDFRQKYSILAAVLVLSFCIGVLVFRYSNAQTFRLGSLEKDSC